jgi:ATP-dependent helicase Lhr and Lhr-like helicase
MDVATRLRPLESWFAQRGWKPFGFQRALWEAWVSGRSGLLHAPTGHGKTLAAWLGTVADALAAKEVTADAPLRLLWITPLRALAVDTTAALQEPMAALGLKWRVEMRTGDTSASLRAKQRDKLPTVLVTTPESLSLLLSYPDAPARLATLQGVIVDEWHELLTSRRGVQTELCLARLRQLNPALRTWGLSATIGNLGQARDVLLGAGQSQGIIISAEEKKRIEIETLLPDEMDRFPWSGHLGLRMLPQVVQQIAKAKTTLLFTNTRNQTETWFQALTEEAPQFAGELAMHHGSLDKKERSAVEDRLRAGSVRCVVCTSSLDLGIDFSPVEQVLQIGSPKGIARLLQRAGRSGHQPGAVSRIIGVPTNAFELVEFAAAREAAKAGAIESRTPRTLTIDVLVQHLLTIAAGGGFSPDEMRREIGATHAFAHLSDAAWEWALRFITTGGNALRAYPQYRRVEITPEGRYVLTDATLMKTHRLSIGTITSDAAVTVQFQSGRKLGTVEEWFISGLKAGSSFYFAGRRLELIRFADLKAIVREAPKTKKSGPIPSWVGSRSPLSTELAQAVSTQLRHAGEATSPEMKRVAPILATQAAWSALPGSERLLIEETRTREGHHLYVYPFAGRLVHEGLGALIASRLAARHPCSIHISMNDYGFELASEADLFALAPDEATWRELLSPTNLVADILACMNTGEMARHAFRDIARVTGLITQGFPGQRKTGRALQVSAALLYDVFAQYDPENLLLDQARREILDRQLELTRLETVLQHLQARPLLRVHTPYLTPMAFPLWADRLGSSLATESFHDRLESMLASLEKAARSAPEARAEIL